MPGPRAVFGGLRCVRDAEISTGSREDSEARIDFFHPFYVFPTSCDLSGELPVRGTATRLLPDGMRLVPAGKTSVWKGLALAARGWDGADVRLPTLPSGPGSVARLALRAEALTAPRERGSFDSDVEGASNVPRSARVLRQRHPSIEQWLNVGPPTPFVPPMQSTLTL